MDRLPAEIVDLIFRNIASPGTGLRHIAPFLRCGRRWFEHAVPFVWKRVCLLAITQECIDNKRRALYASQIETLTGWDGRKCGCGLCQANDPPNSQPRQYLLPHVDLTSIYRLPFPKLRQIQHMRFNDPTLPEMIERLHTADGNTITRLEVSQWHVESALPDFVSLLTNLSQLRVDHLAYHHDEVSVVQPAWDKLTSASMFRNLTYGCDESAMIIHALSDCPELSRLRITIEPAISSLLSPLPPNHADWYKRRGQPFRSLTKLDIRPMRECTSLYQELATMSALNSLTVRFRPASISPAILTYLSRMTQLQELRLIGTSRGGRMGLWSRGTFPPQQRFGCDQRDEPTQDVPTQPPRRLRPHARPGKPPAHVGVDCTQQPRDRGAGSRREPAAASSIFFLAAPTTKLDTPRHREINEDNPPLHQHSKGRRAWAGR
ncbi:hypothetical protein CGGC5_v010278 [Colletotrichum fructicola Nara gc5]|uniref:Uncharacterized protein n=1 Tax=Colletotrichum fructicola (strain Nara gc5) TaxID=1213859 RepID=A0A7J6INA1_COLFN|nr:hypothetical protein CGGC5_v013034 [Colletotrichum fructicola Nara gc5]KAF4480650.1 hypothetical protein CGGC5_v010278 [Colletotrichum fructicola Nara gc5]